MRRAYGYIKGASSKTLSFVVFAGVISMFGFQNWFAVNKPYWKEMTVMAGSGARVGYAPADVHTTMGYMLFSHILEEDILYRFQMPRGYKAGTDIRAGIHWSKSTSESGYVAWKVSYICRDSGGIFAAAHMSHKTLSEIVGNNDTAYRSANAGVWLDDTGLNGMGGVCIMRLWRDVSADDYGADAIMYELDILYQADQPGSVSADSKYN